MPSRSVALGADRLVEPVEPLAEAGPELDPVRSVCSGSIQAPPTPRIARPSLTWSRVAASFAWMPGLRKVFAPTSSPSRIRFVIPAAATRLDQPSKIGWYGSPKIAYR